MWVWALIGLVGGVLLLFTWRTFESFNTPKEAVLKVGLAWLTLALVWRWLRSGSVELPWGPIVAAALVVWGWGWATLLTSSHPLLTARAQLFTAHLVWLALLVPIVLAAGLSLMKFWTGAVVLGGVVALIAIAQFAGLDYEQGVRWLRPSFPLPKTEIYSTIGNPNYLAGVLAFLLPVTLGLMRMNGIGRRWKMVLWAAALCMGAAILVSRSKGGLLAALAGLVAVVILLAWIERWPVKKWLAVTASGGIAALTVLWLASGWLMTEWEGLVRLSSEAPTVKGRLLIWQTAGEMIKAHPVAGIGAGTFGAQYQPYRARVFERLPDPVAVYPAGENSYNETGQAHNDYLQMTAEQGIVGLILFLGLVVLCYATGLKLIRLFCSSAPRPLAPGSLLCGLLAGMTAILIHALVDFPLFQPIVALFFWLAVGTVIAMAVAAGEGHRMLHWQPVWLQAGRIKRGGLVLAILLACLMTVQAVRPVVAAAYQRDAWLAMSRQQWGQAIPMIEKGLQWSPAQAELLLYLGTAYFQQGDFEASESAFQQYQLLYSDYQTLYNLGLIAVNRHDFSGAEALFREALYLKPTLAEAAIALAVVAERTGRPDDARRWREQVARLQRAG